MELIFWWMPLVWAVGLAVVAGLVLRHVRRRRAVDDAGSRPVANSSRLTSLEGYRRAMVRYRALLAALVGVTSLLLVASVGLASRPAGQQVVYTQQSTRDIVLCLDVSGSMIEYDAAIVGVFDQLAREFDGERISLVVFNASAVTYFPLTSDYDYIAEQFDEITEQFASDEGEFFAGTFFGDGSSLIGDGLASCTQRFDGPGVDGSGADGSASGTQDDRSRSIILATDNLLVGDPIFTLAEAAALAEERGIRVYGVNPGDQSSKEYLDSFATEFEDAILSTGGAYYSIEDPDAIPSIVRSIEAEQAVAVRGAPQLVTADQPALLAVAAFLGLAGLMVLAWRLRR